MLPQGGAGGAGRQVRAGARTAPLTLAQPGPLLHQHNL